MYLKKVYEKDASGKPGRVTHVVIGHTGNEPEQTLTSKLVTSGLADGWITINGDKLVMKAFPEHLVYTIKRGPGYFCCHNGQQIPVSTIALSELYRTGQGRIAARECAEYLAKHGYTGKKSPDPKWPAGYGRIEAYDCVLEKKLHERYKASKDGVIALARALKGA